MVDLQTEKRYKFVANRWVSIDKTNSTLYYTLTPHNEEELKNFPKQSADSTTVEISFILTKNNLVSFLLPSSFNLDYFSIFSFSNV